MQITACFARRLCLLSQPLARSQPPATWLCHSPSSLCAASLCGRVLRPPCLLTSTRLPAGCSLLSSHCFAGASKHRLRVSFDALRASLDSVE